MELVHSDICCMRKPSLEGVNYILIFIDDFSLFTRVYFLNNKSQVLEIFKEFRALTEKDCGRPIKCLRLDNGGEYVSRLFQEYLLQNFIS